MKPEQYYLSNGTEADAFVSGWCACCRKETRLRQSKKDKSNKTFCTILTGSMAGKQPKQWIIKNGKPTCTSFVHYQAVRKVNIKKVNEHQRKIEL